MLLGVFETAVFAGSKRRHGVPAPSAAACGALGPAPREPAYPSSIFSTIFVQSGLPPRKLKYGILNIHFY
ncbi:hypothetical protein D1010_03855 [Schleiferilactobacillus harbinensis]|uniref:Uncharacterized protein n=1 Tax=Schleiferilactobacillus harbinensis TaxID=304207 RepID=A0A5P8M2B6_9LACO|nr:hypothetical protein [Schleiferilactobacillus harbinensis]QFR22650.1 hypothetical protein D1010_03855 [Schleiferilactobacillus harbinensis]